jgi:hypothetical protein
LERRRPRRSRNDFGRNRERSEVEPVVPNGLVCSD